MYSCATGPKASEIWKLLFRTHSRSSFSESVTMKMIIVLCSLLTISNALELNSSSLQSKMNSEYSLNNSQFKYLVSLRKNNLQGMHFCCAFAMTRMYLLTAACCITKIQDIKRNKEGKVVVVFRKVDSPETMDTASIRHSIIDSNYPSDVGIILLKKPLKLSENHMPNLAMQPVTAGRLPKVPRFILNSFDVDLLEVEVLSATECQEIYPLLSNDTPQICAKPSDEQKNIYPEDEGSPMIYKNQVVGITSSVTDPARGNPVPYVNVFKHVGYINSIIESPYARRLLLMPCTKIQVS